MNGVWTITPLAIVLVACITSVSAYAGETLDYVITYEPSILMPTGEPSGLDAVDGSVKITVSLDPACVNRIFHREVNIVVVGSDGEYPIETLEAFGVIREGLDKPAGSAFVFQERHFGKLDSLPMTFQLSGHYLEWEPDDFRATMDMEFVAIEGEAVSTEPLGQFKFSSASLWPIDAYWRLVEALRAGETDTDFLLSPFGMPGILPPLESDEASAVARVIDWPPEPLQRAVPDDKIFAGRHWPVRIEVSHTLPSFLAPSYWVVELYESGAPGRWIYDFGYVQILMEPVSVSREPAQNC
jgi:hypothetical protein